MELMERPQVHVFDAVSIGRCSWLCMCPQEHFNYYSVDSALGHLVFSLKYDVIGEQEHLRLMLR